MLLAAGCWPGALRAAPTSGVGRFSFVVANDFHHENSDCDPWFDRLFRQIGTHRALAFCAALGDLANKGRPESLQAMKRALELTGVPFYTVPGNHDNDLEETTALYSSVFPGRLNYTWTHAGWQFVAIDTTDGKKWGDTHVSAATLSWLDAEIPSLDPARPTVLCTHFPLTPIRNLTPLNVEDVLARFEKINLRGVFSGHYHGKQIVTRGSYDLVTDVCCSRFAKNHDGSLEKGYWLCRAEEDGTLRREFVSFAG